jgi:alpha(1,3/1,4) fucosyltransferase
VKKISFVVQSYNNGNKIFDLDDKVVNFCNLNYQYYLLKQKFALLGYDFSTMDINPIETSDAVIYRNVPVDLPAREKRDRSFLIMLESRAVRPRNYDLGTHEFFAKIFTNADDLVDDRKYYKVNYTREFPSSLRDRLEGKEKFCVLIAANKKQEDPQELTSERLRLIRWFDRNHPEEFDLYGKDWDLYTFSGPPRYLKRLNRYRCIRKLFAQLPSCYRGMAESKSETLSKYRFCIAYENVSGVNGYITEKLFDAFIAGCVPVYFGAPNITAHVPKDCFIDRRDFVSHEDLYSHMKSITDWQFREYIERIEAYLGSEAAKEYTPVHFAETISREVVRQLECQR